ncbi:MAG: PHP domain-containing protein [Candidatus Hadarchaeaceae archaeon]
MAKKFADLHVHTRASDGGELAGEVVRQAREVGLAAIGIADHDSVDGIGAALKASGKYEVEVIPSVELSAYLDNSELHILGYFINWRDERFKAMLRMFQEVRMNRAKEMVEKLRGLGLDISYEDVLVEADKGVVGRPHVARALTNHGYVKSINGAFERYIGAGGPAYVDKYRLPSVEAIKEIRRIGGIPVLAHPLYGFREEMLPELLKQGLKGIEVYHSKHDISATRRFEDLARQHNLLVTGGSDSHGFDVPVGTVRVPYELVEKLKAERKL